MAYTRVFRSGDDRDEIHRALEYTQSLWALYKVRRPAEQIGRPNSEDCARRGCGGLGGSIYCLRELYWRVYVSTSTRVYPRGRMHRVLVCIAHESQQSVGHRSLPGCFWGFPLLLDHRNNDVRCSVRRIGCGLPAPVGPLHSSRVHRENSMRDACEVPFLFHAGVWGGVRANSDVSITGRVSSGNGSVVAPDLVAGGWCLVAEALFREPSQAQAYRHVLKRAAIAGRSAHCTAHLCTNRPHHRVSRACHNPVSVNVNRQCGKAVLCGSNSVDLPRNWWTAANQSRLPGADWNHFTGEHLPPDDSWVCHGL